MEITYSLPQSKIFSQNVQQEQPIEKFLGNKLSEMSNIIINHQSKTKIIKAVKYTIETNSDIVNYIPDFISARDTFCHKENTLCNFYEETRKNFIDIISNLSEALKEHGLMTENSEIIEHGNLKKDRLLKMTDRELVFNGLAIFNFAKPYCQTLCQLGNLTSFISKMDNHQNFSGSANSSDSNSIIDIYNKIYNEIKEFLCRTLDGLVNELREQHPRFYVEYKSARLAATLESLQNNNSAPAWII